MIRPLNVPQLSSAKPRGGLQSITDLLPKLIEQYELQAKARQQIEADNRRRKSMKRNGPVKQTTFGW